MNTPTLEDLAAFINNIYGLAELHKEHPEDPKFSDLILQEAKRAHIAINQICHQERLAKGGRALDMHGKIIALISNHIGISEAEATQAAFEIARREWKDQDSANYGSDLKVLVHKYGEPR
jgi:hypothetical protein